MFQCLLTVWQILETGSIKTEQCCAPSVELITRSMGNCLPSTHPVILPRTSTAITTIILTAIPITTTTVLPIIIIMATPPPTLVMGVLL